MTNVQSPNRWDWLLFRGLRGASAGDLAAGLTLAAIALPEQMATARLGGLPPQIGLFAFVAGTLGFAAFGANRRLSVGADSTITPIFAGSLAALAATGSSSYVELAAALALMVGLIVLGAGLFKMGWIADLISGPVMTGLLAGIALHIVISQAPSLLGLPEGHGSVYHRLAALWREAGGINLIAVAIGAAVFAIVLACERIDARIPGALIGLVGATLLTIQFHLAARGVAVLGELPGGLPPIGLPTMGFEKLLPLVGLAGLVSLVVTVQTAATTRSFSEPGEDPDVDRDLVGAGAGGLLAGLVGAFPVNASPPRTAAVAEAGGRSQYSALLAALAILLLALFGRGLLAQTPVAALAGVLLFVAQRIFHVDEFARALARAPGEFALAVATALLIVLLPIQTGAAIGMFMSLARGMFTISQARLLRFERVEGTTVWWPVSTYNGGGEDGVLVAGFQAPLFFLNVYEFRREVLHVIGNAHPNARLFVLEASSVVSIDFTASAVLTDLISKLRARGVDFAVARLESVRAQAAFDRLGVTDSVGKDHIFRSVADAVQALVGQPHAPEGIAGEGAKT
jgi:MFS superfamily sulfate permease-like transporter